MRALLRHLTTVVGPPIALLLAVFALEAELTRTPALFRSLLPHLPYLLLLPSLGLALLFNRGRAFLLLLILAGFYAIASDPPAWTWRGRPLDADMLLLGTAFLLPLNIVLFAEVQERGVFTRHGLLRMGVLAVQGVLLAVLATGAPDLIGGWLLAEPMGHRVALRAPLSQWVVIAFAFGVTLLLLRHLVEHTPFEVSLVGALAAQLMMLWRGLDPASMALYSTAGGLLILIAIVQESHRMAYRDDLTGLPARRALQEALLKLGPRYAIAMVDVDHFKQFNDRHGHDIGDQVLKMVAARLREVSGGGRPFRYGGEEFTVLFPGKTVAHATPHLERLRAAIEASSFQLRGKDRPQKLEPSRAAGRARADGGPAVSVTVSIGVAERNEHHPTPETVIKRADQALYLAKGGGRNRVCG